ncbi:hypothetical protein BD770DRAFT_407089 [Pilaira anomala]|nr:hypothetical protein BD770DRAFT_407089 [Pilaira anomala]
MVSYFGAILEETYWMDVTDKYSNPTINSIFLRGDIYQDDENHQSNSPFDIRKIHVPLHLKLHEPLVYEDGREGDRTHQDRALLSRKSNHQNLNLIAFTHPLHY